jgi:hypothetical protein
MKTMIIAAVAALSLGTGAAFAAGGPVGFDAAPAYGSQAFSDHSKDAQVEFLGRGTVLGKMFHSSTDNNNQATVSTATKS